MTVYSVGKQSVSLIIHHSQELYYYRALYSEMDFVSLTKYHSPSSHSLGTFDFPVCNSNSMDPTRSFIIPSVKCVVYYNFTLFFTVHNVLTLAELYEGTFF
jgi:hypothetical protein